MKIGYARTSTVRQNLDTQIEMLKDQGCELIFSDQLSGKNARRPGLKTMMAKLRKGDTVVIVKLDRLGRSLRDLFEITQEFQGLEVDLVSIQDNIDTSTPTGRLLFNVMGSVAEFERELIQERITIGIKSAKAKGVKFGRPKNENRIKAVKRMSDMGMGASEIAKSLGVSRMSVYRWLNESQENVAEVA